MRCNPDFRTSGRDQENIPVIIMISLCDNNDIPTIDDILCF